MNIIIYTLVMVQITIACVTLYLHRSQAHRAVTFHPVVAHAMRFWLWMTTGMVTKQWVAIHRKHHRFDDAEGDPHSPHVFGIWNIFLRGVYYYYLSAKDARMTLSYGAGTPDDWMERKIYSKYNYVGVGIMLAIDILFFGWWGPLVWAAQMLWIPFWAAGVVNGIGHWWGYRNTDTKDFSRNIVPWDFWVGGELLHNNHHADPASPKLSLTWYEFDIGWMYIQLLRCVGLAKIKNV
jgi:stearoyl-CoA desaturase (delta-9 desaturase)